MHRTAIDIYTGERTPGIDVSAYQPGVNWSRVAGAQVYAGDVPLGIPRFCLIRAADGVQTRTNSKPDPWAVRHLNGAHRAGLLVDVYVFVRAHHSAAAQVEVLLDVLRVAGVPVRTVWLDVEGRPDDPTTPDTNESKGICWAPAGVQPPTIGRALKVLREMRARLESLGFRTGIYSGAAWHWYFSQRGRDVTDFEDCPLWTAWYSKTASDPGLPVGPRGEPWPWRHADIWQVAGSKRHPGRIAGVDGIVDVNLYRGNEGDLARFWEIGDRTTLTGLDTQPITRAVSELHAIAERLESTHPCDAQLVACTADELSARRFGASS